MKTNIPHELEGLAVDLPKRAYSVFGNPMEPVSLIIVGSKKGIESLFMTHGWYKAIKPNPVSLTKALFAIIFNKSYLMGPITPGFINKKPHKLGFQLPTKSNTFRRRHHLRLWRTKYRLNSEWVWVGTLSYDRGIGFSKEWLMPTHHISPTLNIEEDFLAHSLGIKNPSYLRLGRAERGRINTGDAYSWDGEALVIRLNGS